MKLAHTCGTGILHTGKDLLICSHLATPLEQGDLGLALAVLVDEFVKKRRDDRPLLQGRLSGRTSRCHCGVTASTHQEPRGSVKRGLDPSSRAGAGQSAGKLRAGDGAEGHDARTMATPRSADSGRNVTGCPAVRNKI